MNDRLEMLEATLNLIDAGVAILDCRSSVLFWNKAAADLTGYGPEDLVSLPCPQDLYRIEDRNHSPRISPFSNASCRHAVPVSHSVTNFSGTVALLEPLPDEEDNPAEVSRCPTRVTFNHKCGHSIPGMLRRIPLHDRLGHVDGTVLLFYPAEQFEDLPHGDAGGNAEIERSQADMEERLEAAQHQWRSGAVPFGLLWISVDQAESLRRTHGCDACESMLRTVEQTLLRQMKPAEILGRWGSNEFLALAHERTAALLLEHARRLAGLARTADFRWWGDRIGLTVSIGAAHAGESDSLQSLLSRARQAMRASAYAGGNQATEARER